MANLVGKTLGKYHIVERLGRGGMAEVYKAYHAKLDRHVTIKILHSYLVEGQDFLARFEREAKAVATLRHPHVVQIHDYEVEDDTYYMVVEYIDGGNLQVRLDELARAGAYMPIGTALGILKHVGEALDYAHRRGIIHRDIKPSNILLDSRGNAYLSDFGIARIVGGAQFTTTGSMIGTPAYMSPEQGLGGTLSDASDIYSLGVVAYQMLTGKVPFAADTPLAIIHKQVNEPPLAARVLRPDLPEQVDSIIAKALAKKPEERYQTAAELQRDLEKALPPEIAKRLDAGAAPDQVPLAAAPTMRVDEGEIPTPQREPKASRPISEQGREPAAFVSQKVGSDGGSSTAGLGATPKEKVGTRAIPEVQRAPSDRPKGLVWRIALAVLGIGVIAAGAVWLLNGEKPPASQGSTQADSTPYPWNRTAAASTALPVAAPPTARSSSTAATGSVYTENFEDNLAQGWDLERGWKVTLDGSNHVLYGEDHFWAFSQKAYWQDNRLSFRLKPVQGSIHLVSHHNDIGRYYIGFERDGSVLNKQFWPSKFIEGLAISSTRHDADAWHAIEIVSQGGTLELSVDSKREFSYTDPDPLIGGDFAFETQTGARAYVDDIVLELLAAP